MTLLEALSSTELLNFLIYDTTLAAAASQDFSDATLILENNWPKPQQGEEEVEVGAEAKEGVEGARKRVPRQKMTRDKTMVMRNPLGAQQGVRKKRKRRPRVCKNKEEAENQRMTHIAVERNRRKQMNEHLAVLRSLMPDFYVQRGDNHESCYGEEFSFFYLGDQASIVGGAVEFVKELEHLLQNLEAQKLQLLQRGRNPNSQNQDNIINNNNDNDEEDEDDREHVTTIFLQPPFSQFFLYPQITWSQSPNNNNNNNLATASVADIEVTLIETHANLRILSRRNPWHLSKLVAGFHSLRLAILHLSVTTLDPLVLYSISAKVEEGCQLSTVDDIAGAVHHMLRIIEDGCKMT